MNNFWIKRRYASMARKMVKWNLVEVLPALASLYGEKVSDVEFEIRYGPSVITSVKVENGYAFVNTCLIDLLLEWPDTEVLIDIDEDTGVTQTKPFKRALED